MDSQAIADYLYGNPHFFEEHSELLAKVKLTSPVAGRTLSLQERQMEVLRDKIKGMELRLAELVRIGQENDVLHSKFQAWVQSLLLAPSIEARPLMLVEGLKTVFSVPQVTLRLWNVNEAFAASPFAAAVSEDAKIFCNGLASPFCGRNDDFEAASWLEDSGSIKSVALVPLRRSAAEPAFGLLVLGSPDASRFTSDMATDFLAHIGETGSAALTCLLQ